jgi:putative methyltransferase (TIGR04325 family)
VRNLSSSLRVRRFLEALENAPGIRQWRRRQFEREFIHDPFARLFDGVYATFDEALRHVPAGVQSSYDSRAAIERYTRRVHIEEYDYPPLFWIADAFERGWLSVADVGGSVGIKCYAFAEYLQFPEGWSWRVIDVPAAVTLGNEVARARGASANITFSSPLTDADGFDVLMCLGSLQFLPVTLGEMLDSLHEPPRRIIINTTPIHETRSFFTLHSMGTAICPYRVTDRRTFVDDVQRRGYHLRHQWQNISKDMRLPFHRGFDVEHYSGFCFDRTR